MEALALCAIALLVAGNIIVIELIILTDITFRKTGKPIIAYRRKSKKDGKM